MATNRRIAILGAGKIGESLLAGLLSSGWRKPGDIVVTVRGEERLKELMERHGVEGTLDNASAIADAGLIVIAVKPQDFDVLLGEVGGLITPEQTVLSVAAATRRSFPRPGSRSCGSSPSAQSRRRTPVDRLSRFPHNQGQTLVSGTRLERPSCASR